MNVTYNITYVYLYIYIFPDQFQYSCFIKYVSPWLTIKCKHIKDIPSGYNSFSFQISRDNCFKIINYRFHLILSKFIHPLLLKLLFLHTKLLVTQ